MLVELIFWVWVVTRRSGWCFKSTSFIIMILKIDVFIFSLVFVWGFPIFLQRFVHVQFVLCVRFLRPWRSEKVARLYKIRFFFYPERLTRRIKKKKEEKPLNRKP